jgi:hypothetical protein
MPKNVGKSVGPLLWRRPCTCARGTCSLATAVRTGSSSSSSTAKRRSVSTARTSSTWARVRFRNPPSTDGGRSAGRRRRRGYRCDVARPSSGRVPDTRRGCSEHCLARPTSEPNAWRAKCRGSLLTVSRWEASSRVRRELVAGRASGWRQQAAASLDGGCK